MVISGNFIKVISFEGIAGGMVETVKGRLNRRPRMTLIFVALIEAFFIKSFDEKFGISDLSPLFVFVSFDVLTRYDLCCSRKLQ